MKKRLYLPLCAALALVLVLPVSAAKAGTVVNHALYTDIVAQIDGHPLRSYNVDGRTAVVAEDLRDYGFYALWNPIDRILRVERAVDQSGNPETPVSWPQYTPETLKHPVGSRAQDILSTDIVAYVGGEKVESFNINGETLIWFSDLDAYGAVAFDEAGRTASLTLGDPMQIQLDLLIQKMEDVRDFISVEYQLYPCDLGTLFVGYYNGTPHGTSCVMTFVKRSGTRINVINMLPGCGFGANYYARPREITLDAASATLSFITPVMEEVNWAAGESKDWGDTLCKVDLISGRMTQMLPLYGELPLWQAFYASYQEQWAGGEPSPCLQITVTKQAGEGEPVILEAAGPSGDYSVSFSQSGFVVTHFASLAAEPGFSESAYNQAYAILWNMLPRVSQDDFSPDNTPELRIQAGQYVKVTYNGQPVTGDLWWGQGNNHADLCMDFDESITLKDGDILTLWVGLPPQN